MLIAAFITQHKWRAAELRHHQIRLTLSRYIRHRDRARLIQLDRIEVRIPRDVSPALAPQISQQP